MAVRDDLMLGEIAVQMAIRAVSVRIDGAQVAAVGAQDRAHVIPCYLGDMERADLALTLYQRKDGVLVVTGRTLGALALLAPICLVCLNGFA